MSDTPKKELARIDVRRAPRYRVHLSVRYGNALEFVRDYAKDLSQGGLFISGAQHLMLNSKIGVEVDLPGRGKFQLAVRVAHIIDEATAAERGREAGAGLEIVDAPEGFADALSQYLITLGVRKDHSVLTSDPSYGMMLEVAGFHVGRLPEPEDVESACEGREHPVVGLVVGADDAPDYRHELSGTPFAALLITVDDSDDPDAILQLLDRRIAENHQ